MIYSARIKIFLFSFVFFNASLNAMILPQSLHDATVQTTNISNNVFMIVVQKKSEIVGEISYKILGDYNIEYLNAEPRGEGVGTYLLLKAMNHLISLNEKNSIRLVCKEKKIPFYQRVGFKPTRSVSNRYVEMCYDPLTTQTPVECLAEYYKNKQQMSL